MHYVDRRRTYASVLMVVATALLCLSVGGPWWQLTLNSYNPLTDQQTQNLHVSYDLGGYIACSTWTWEPPSFPCANLSEYLHGDFGMFYVAGGFLVIGLAELGAIISALLWVGNAGLNLGRRQLRAVLTLLLAFVVVAGSFLVGTAVVGPGPQGHAFCYQYSGNYTSCPTFSGSVTPGEVAGECFAPCAYAMSWGPGTSFYEALLATGLGGMAWSLMWVGRKGPYSAPEQLAWSATNRPLSLTGLGLTRSAPGEPLAVSPMAEYTQPTPSLADSRLSTPPILQTSVYPSGGSRDAWRCLGCGRINSPWAARCGHCRKPRPPG